MILVIDTNRIIAALIRDSASRKIILNPKLRFVSVNFGRKELEKHKKEIIKKANISEVELEKLIAVILNRIYVLNDIVIEENLASAKKIMDSIDKSDTIFIAAALALNCSIWSDDKHFQKQTKVKIWKTEDIIKYFDLSKTTC